MRRKLLCAASAVLLASLTTSSAAPAPQRAATRSTTRSTTARAERIPPLVFHSHNPECEILIDISDAPDLKEWVETKLGPTLAEWYPKIAEMMPSEGYTPPTTYTVLFPLTSGVANTSWNGDRIVVRANPTWLKSQFGREALGAMVHEQVHVIQNYGGANRRGPTTRSTPATRPAGATTQARGRRGGGQDTGWLTEGIADYVRWWYYEPDGPRRYNIGRNPNYNGAYTVTANFLIYVSRKYDKDLVKKLNAALRERRYTPELWKEYTGKDLETLNTEWKAQLPPPQTRPARRGT